MDTVAGSAARRLSVLIVDDNRDSADTLALILSGGGYGAATAYDGDEAVKLIDASRYDVVLCDIGLPGRSGYEVAKHVRLAAAHKPLMVAISAYASPDMIKTARESGFDAFFAKPAEPSDIERLLEQYARRHDDSRRTDFVPVHSLQADS